jgi:hypothetical protein
MARYIQSICLSLLTVLLISGCTTFPEPKTEEDTLLLIHVGYKKEIPEKLFGRYRIRIVSETKDVERLVRIEPTKKYLLIKGLPSGRYRIVERAFVYENGSIGSTDNTDIRFILESKRVTIVPTTFLYRLYREPNESGYYMSGLWSAITQTDARDLLQRLQKDGLFDKWELSYGTRRHETFEIMLDEMNL